METKRISYKQKVDKTLSIRIDEESLMRLDKVCQKWKCTRGEAVRRLIKEARV